MKSAASLTHPYLMPSGKMPHELDYGSFDRWLKREVISEHDYWVEIGTNTDLTDAYGEPLLTRDLKADQRGWAKQRFTEHYRTNGAKWYVRPEKPSVPVPAIKHNNKTKKRRRYS